MKYRICGKIILEKERNFSKELNGESERDALSKLYSLFGSQNRLPRTKIKVEKIEKIE